MIYLLCAAVVVLVGVVAGQAFRIAALGGEYDALVDRWVHQGHLNSKIIEKLRLVGQRIG